MVALVIQVCALYYMGRWFVDLIQSNLALIAVNSPQEFNEPTIWYPSWLLAHGQNPYSVDKVCEAAYAFGPFYSVVQAILSPINGIGYSSHRLFDFCEAGLKFF